MKKKASKPEAGEEVGKAALIEIRGTPRGNASGYTVNLLRAGEVVEEYTVSANPRDSHQPGESPSSLVRQWARQTCREMFVERFGRPPKRGEVELTFVETPECL